MTKLPTQTPTMSASRTALLVAGLRGLGTEKGLCNDPWAARLAGIEGIEEARRILGKMPYLLGYVTLRAAWIDRFVRLATGEASSIGQVVLLGAGFDTRAARLGRPGVRFFEVDHPASQESKLEAVRTLEDYPVGAAHYIPCLFGEESFLEKLGEVGFCADEPALFIFEGVTYYLQESEVRATFQAVASSHAGSLIVFDYIRTPLLRLYTDPARTAPPLKEVAARGGETIRWGIDDPIPLLGECGLPHAALIGFGEAALSLGRSGEESEGALGRYEQTYLAVAGKNPIPPDLTVIPSGIADTCITPLYRIYRTGPDNALISFDREARGRKGVLHGGVTAEVGHILGGLLGLTPGRGEWISVELKQKIQIPSMVLARLRCEGQARRIEIYSPTVSHEGSDQLHAVVQCREAQPPPPPRFCPAEASYKPLETSGRLGDVVTGTGNPKGMRLEIGTLTASDGGLYYGIRIPQGVKNRRDLIRVADHVGGMGGYMRAGERPIVTTRISFPQIDEGEMRGEDIYVVAMRESGTIKRNHISDIAVYALDARGNLLYPFRIDCQIIDLNRYLDG